MYIDYFFFLGVSYLIGRGFLIAGPLRILPYPGSILTYFSYSTYLVSYGSLSAYHYYQVESIVYIYLRTCAVYVDDYGISYLLTYYLVIIMYVVNNCNNFINNIKINISITNKSKQIIIFRYTIMQPSTYHYHVVFCVKYFIIIKVLYVWFTDV